MLNVSNAFQMWEGAVIKPDQMQVVNAACILAFIPLFDRLVYPIFSEYRAKLLSSNLSRYPNMDKTLQISAGC